MKFVKIIMSAVTLSVLVGCATVKEARKVQSGEKMLPCEKTVSFAESGLVADHELTLAELEDAAMKCNPSILQAEQNILSAEIGMKNAKADYFPSLTTGISHSRSTDNTRAGHTGFSHTGKYSGDVSLKMMIYDFGRTSAAVKQAAENLVQAKLGLQSAQNNVRYSVRQAFFEFHRTIHLNQVAIASVDQYNSHLKRVLDRKEAGMGTPYDCTKAEVDYHNSVLNQLKTENNIEIARANLNLAMGFAENPQYVLAAGELKEYSDNVDELMAIAREKEPSLAQLRSDVLATSYYLDETIAELYPELSLNLTLSASGRNPGMPWLWNMVGAGSISQSIFNAGRNMNAINLAVIQLRIARSKVAAAEQKLYSNLRKAVLNMVLAKRQLGVAQMSEASAKQNLDIVTEQFNVGQVTSIERTDAQVGYYEAKANVVSAQYDYLDAVATIAYLIGE